MPPSEISMPTNPQKRFGSATSSGKTGNTKVLVFRVTASVQSGGSGILRMEINPCHGSISRQHGICLYPKKERPGKETFSSPRGWHVERERTADLFENTSSLLRDSVPRDTRGAWKRADSLISPGDVVDRIHIGWPRLSIQYASIIWYVIRWNGGGSLTSLPSTVFTPRYHGSPAPGIYLSLPGDESDER